MMFHSGVFGGGIHCVSSLVSFRRVVRVFFPPRFHRTAVFFWPPVDDCAFPACFLPIRRNPSRGGDNHDVMFPTNTLTPPARFSRPLILTIHRGVYFGFRMF